MNSNPLILSIRKDIESRSEGYSINSKVDIKSSVSPYIYYLGMFGWILCAFSCSDKQLIRSKANTSTASEQLYNGIILPETWPPKDLNWKNNSPLPVPYLKEPPEVIPIHIGRQLFVDDFLIEERTLERVFYKAKKYKSNPILEPTTAVEMNNGFVPVAAPFNGGVWYDPHDSLFKMWYHAGWFDGVGYASSQDGLNWKRPTLDVVPGTNRVLEKVEGYERDGSTVWLDHNARKPSERFKMFLYYRKKEGDDGGHIFTSADGIHWNDRGMTGKLGDNSGFFYNPFRKKWVFSIRTRRNYPRQRDYHEHDDFLKASQWNNDEHVFWLKSDSLDISDPAIGDTPQLYNVDAVAYESLMVGLFAIHKGPKNSVASKGGFPKITDLTVGYSRDGFHFSRPDREAIISGSRKYGNWDRDYIHSAGGAFLVVKDKLFIYYGAFSGDSPKLKQDMTGPSPAHNSMYAGGATGVAFLRRDGFASLNTNKSGYIITKPVVFDGNFLFVNADMDEGEMVVEVLDKEFNVISTFSKEDSNSIVTDSTIQQVTWKNGSSLESLGDRKIRFKFYLTNGSLYSFWISKNANGASGGYIGAGGPGFEGLIDNKGLEAY